MVQLGRAGADVVSSNILRPQDAPGYIDIVAGCAIGIPGSGGAESAGTENFRQSMGSCVRKELRHEGEKERRVSVQVPP